MSVLYFLLISYILLSVSLYPLFQKATIPPYKALIPIINCIEWCRIIGRPTWWAALLFLPIVNIFILAGMSIDMVRSFKKYSFWDSALAVIEKLHHDRLFELYKQGATERYRMLKEQSPYYKSPSREWTEAVVFSVFAAAFIRLFTIEAYAIPTSSMEGSLLVGDHLFVSKLHHFLKKNHIYISLVLCLIVYQP